MMDREDDVEPAVAPEAGANAEETAHAEPRAVPAAQIRRDPSPCPGYS